MSCPDDFRQRICDADAEITMGDLSCPLIPDTAPASIVTPAFPGPLLLLLAVVDLVIFIAVTAMVVPVVIVTVLISPAFFVAVVSVIILFMSIMAAPLMPTMVVAITVPL
jgi:hypothetical protein